MICRSCNSKNLSSILDLGEQPWCNDFLAKENIGKENTYPLNLMCLLDRDWETRSKIEDRFLELQDLQIIIYVLFYFIDKFISCIA